MDEELEPLDEEEERGLRFPRLNLSLSKMVYQLLRGAITDEEEQTLADICFKLNAAAPRELRDLYTPRELMSEALVGFLSIVEGMVEAHDRGVNTYEEMAVLWGYRDSSHS